MTIDRHLALGIVIGLVLSGIALYATKPECRTGYTATIGLGAGWYCSTGYKPD